MRRQSPSKPLADSNICRACSLHLLSLFRSPLWTINSMVLPHSQMRKARQHLGAEERQFAEIIDKRDRDAAHARRAEAGKFLRHAVGCPDERITADGIG